MKVCDIYASIQGEGTLTGTPMIILRLQGCGVGCPWCDTKFTWEADPALEVSSIDKALGDDAKWVDQSPVAIAEYLKAHYGHLQWVLLTGGEPAEQDLAELADALHDQGFKIALETSGTATGLLEADLDWVCVSPKFNMPGGKAVLPQVLAQADEIKQVVGKPQDIEFLAAFLGNCSLKLGAIISLQPVSQSPKATALCVEQALLRNWHVSLQTHKYMQVR